MYKSSHKKTNKSTTQRSAPKKETHPSAFSLEDNRPQSVAQQETQQLISTYIPPNSVLQKKESTTGLPDTLKEGVEQLSGIAMDDVKVHYNSNKPAQLQAHAYAKGTDIHLATGQEKQLPHEAWHVVQQKQGRVAPTTQFKDKIPVNDDISLEKEADVMGKKAAQLISTKRVAPQNTSLQTKNLTTPNTPIQGVFKYTAAIALKDVNSEKDTSANELQIDSITLPETDRTKTKYNNKQQSHSISWTLIKSAYTTVENLPLDYFINKYLKPDWKALDKQRKFMNGNNKAYKKLNAYLNKYTENYFTKMVKSKKDSLTFYQKTQEAISDYFVALQLAPLTTHSGRTLKLDNTQASDEFNASHHGEATANKKLSEIEKKLKSGYNSNYQQQVVKYVRNYWDPGVDNQNGINDPEAIELISHKLTTSLSRTFPNIWKVYGKEITTKIIDRDIKKAKNNVKKHPSLKNNPNTSNVTDTKEVSSPAYYARIKISNKKAAKKTTATHLTIEKLSLSKDRPPTKFGETQKSHAIPWTLTLKAMKNSAENKTLYLFIKQMMSHWKALKKQEWTDTKNLEKKHKTRFINMEARITPAIENLKGISKNTLKSNLEWTNFIVDNICDYFEVYATAPLTVHKDGTSNSNGEVGANNFFKKLEKEPNKIEWRKKFNQEFRIKKVHPKTNNKSSKKILFPEDEEKIKKIKSEYLKTKEEEFNKKENVKKVLIRQHALKYLDVRWHKTGLKTVKLRIKERAIILNEWENSLRNAFPKTWKQYKDIFMEIADKDEIPKNTVKNLKKKEQLDDTNNTNDSKSDDSSVSDDDIVISNDTNNLKSEDSTASNNDITISNNNNNNLKSENSTASDNDIVISNNNNNNLKSDNSSVSDNDITISNNNNNNKSSSDSPDSLLDYDTDTYKKKQKESKSTEIKKMNMSSYMEKYHKKLALKDARRGDLSINNTFTTYNTIIQHYRKGVENASKGLPRNAINNKAHHSGHDDYIKGVNAAKKTPEVDVQYGHYGYKKGYNDYRKGFLDADKNTNSFMPTSVPWSYQQAWESYTEGYQDAKNKKTNTQKNRCYELAYTRKETSDNRKRKKRDNDENAEVNTSSKRQKLISNNKNIPKG